MPSTYPGAPDDLTAGNTGLDHGQVSDAVAAVQATLGVNPQGDAADVAARFDGIGTGLDGRTILSGAGAPASGSGLDPLDGVNDPWRWSPFLVGWVVAAYECSWSDGDAIPYVTAVDRGAADQFDVYISTAFATLPEATAGDVVTKSSGTAFDGSPTDTTLTGTGSGAVIVVQYEAGFAHSTVPEPTFDPTGALVVGPLVIGAPITFPDVQTGVDGDFYIDTTAHTLYGPKAGTWPSPVSLIGPQGDPGADGLPILTSPDSTQWRVIVDDAGVLSTEPA